MVLPIQPPATWERNAPWTRFLRDDVRWSFFSCVTPTDSPRPPQLPKVETYSQILTTHLQSANNELRYAMAPPTLGAANLTDIHV